MGDKRGRDDRDAYYGGGGGGRGYGGGGGGGYGQSESSRGAVPFCAVVHHVTDNPACTHVLQRLNIRLFSALLSHTLLLPCRRRPP